jgi:hypothetical protein
LRAFADNASVTVVNPSGDALTAVASILLNAKAVRLEGASLTLKQVHTFCDHVELLIRAYVYDTQTFTLLTDPRSIMASGLRFMTSKVMERVPVSDWKIGWEVSLILEALRECCPLAALDNLVSTYDKWYNLYKSIRKTITVDQANISSRPLPTLATCQPIRRRCSSANSKRSSPTSITLTRIMAPTDCSKAI